MRLRLISHKVGMLERQPWKDGCKHPNKTPRITGSGVGTGGLSMKQKNIYNQQNIKPIRVITPGDIFWGDMLATISLEVL